MAKPFLALAVGVVALAGFGMSLLPADSASAPAASLAKTEPVLLELLTSQGCPSCPPADQLAEKLAADPGLVVISRPLTYWDRLGWKDSLVREDDTALQQACARAGLVGQNGVYTPQLVIDGGFGTVGSREAEMRSGIARHGSKGSAAIRLRDLGAKSVAVGIGGTAARPAEMVLVAAKRKTGVAIARGENGGRKVGYTNVLKNEQRLQSWDGSKAGLVNAPEQLVVGGADRYALVLREPDGGKVLAVR